MAGSVLFGCSHNVIRSPMAERVFKQLHGKRFYAASCGVRPLLDLDPFALAVMAELGLDLSDHRPRSFEELDDTSFDLIISLSPDAQHKAIMLTHRLPASVEYWKIPDPSLREGNREDKMTAYRETRDLLVQKILSRFPLGE